MFYVYVLECADGTLYTGYTNNVPNRVKAHNGGKGAKYTATRTPVKLVAKWAYADKRQAMRIEYAFKQLSKTDKLKKINGFVQSSR